MQPEKLICAGCLALSAGAIAVGTHQPVASVQNDAGDVRVEYAMPYSGWGKLLSLGCVVGSGVFLSLGLKSVNNSPLPNLKKHPRILVERDKNALEQTLSESQETAEPLQTKQKSALEQTEDNQQNFFEILRSHKKKHTFSRLRLVREKPLLYLVRWIIFTPKAQERFFLAARQNQLLGVDWKI